MSWTVTHDLSPQEADKIYRWLSEESYWAKGLPRDVFERSLAHSLCFVLRNEDGGLTGFARMITDQASFAYLCDVFIDPERRGEGGGKALMRAIMEHPNLQGLRRMMLATRDAHHLYAQFGFEPLNKPEIFMQRHDPHVYDQPGR